MSFLDEIAAKLVSANVGVLTTDLFLGARPVIPNGVGPFMNIAETPSVGPMRTHNSRYQRSSGQFTARAMTYQAARSKAKAAYDALIDVNNVELSGTFYLAIYLDSEPFELSLDAQNRPRVVFNFTALKEPS